MSAPFWAHISALFPEPFSAHFECCLSPEVAFEGIPLNLPHISHSHHFGTPMPASEFCRKRSWPSNLSLNAADLQRSGSSNQLHSQNLCNCRFSTAAWPPGALQMLLLRQFPLACLLPLSNLGVKNQELLGSPFSRARALLLKRIPPRQGLSSSH